MRDHSAPGLFFAWISLSLPLLSARTALAQDWEPSFHRDHRQTLKYQIFPAMPVQLASQDPVSLGWSFLRSQAAEFGLTPDLYGIKLQKTRESLLGVHLHFIQEQGGIPIEGAELVLSILKSDMRIYQVYSNMQPRPMSFSINSKKLNLDAAYDRAWNFLAVQGKLFEAPKGVLSYVMEGDKLRAAYRIELSTTAPYGAWKIYVDAESGKILRYTDQRISHRPWQIKEFIAAKGPVANRRASFATWEKSAEKSSISLASGPALGKANLFDPDPRTTLLSANLQDNSPQDLFDAAYLPRELKDIAFDGTSYRLDGPWVKIEDWDPPTAAPSTSANGEWTALRGQNAFNDAMTYYHIDKSQRYMQSLGFTGDRGIQFGPIVADTNGVNGDDNSYFQPSSNKLSFGHGCVDDNEDADVILHEYGHAIHFSINSNWDGGDTGAMGEGFGDYWAASYSLSTSNGPQFRVNEIYSWDGHGEGSPCWPGRVLNAVAATYDPNTDYGAHMTIPGGFQSDELWSTPLFQSLLQLRALGVPREEVDTIILQAQFGLGADIKMRDMAQAIVLTAEQLYRTGPHARVFKENFIRQNILQEPHPVLTAQLKTVTDSGGDSIVDPGEDLDLSFQLSNSGNLVATHVIATVSSSDALTTVIQGSSPYSDLEPAQSAVNSEMIKVRIGADTACGSLVKLQLLVKYDDKSLSFPFELRVGRPVGISTSSSPRLAIPDADAKGAVDGIVVTNSGAVSDQFKVGLDVRHPYRGDLKVILTSPSGKQVILHDRTGVSGDDLVGTYPTTLIPKDSLSLLVGEPIMGRWQLQVADLASADIGTFQTWSLEDITSYQCQAR